jgi:oligopeptide transport system permease protein
VSGFLSFVLKRLGWMAATAWVVYTFSFFLMYSVPGGPYSRERRLPPILEQQYKERYRLDDPVYKQYLDSLWDAVRGDLRLSYKIEDFTVNEIVAQGFPISASLGILALTFAICFGLTAGVLSASRRNSATDVAFMGAAAVGIAVPSFVLASLAIIVFVFGLHWLPAGGWGTVQQLLLPSLCLAAPIAAYIARLSRAGMLEVLNLDYIRTAYAKGLSERRVVLKHALRGAIIPVISYLGPAAAGVLTGSVVIERIFNIPGMGTHFVEAAVQRDYTLALGIVMVYTVLLLVLNFLVDLSYALIDPRVKLE